MWLMLNQEKCHDYVLATGRLNKVKDVLQKAFAVVGLDYREYIVIAEKYKRFIENVPLVGEIDKIYNDLGWRPNIEVNDIILEMVNYDLKIN
jgi:GDPmannose 4,6-dehydratase